MPVIEHEEWCQGGHLAHTCWEVGRLRWLNRLDPSDCPVGRHGYGYHSFTLTKRDVPEPSNRCLNNCGAIWADVLAQRGVETLRHYLDSLNEG